MTPFKGLEYGSLYKVVNRLEEKPPGAGRSSFSLIDPEKVLGGLRLKPGSVFLDMACGAGQYAVAASEIVGDEGFVYAIDLWEEGITTLMEQMSVRGIRNIQAMVRDITKPIPIDRDCVDVCLMATALHELTLSQVADAALTEAARVLGSGGILAILEFDKIDRPPGPPIHIRLTPDDVERIVSPHGFSKEQVTDVGPYNYLMTFNIGDAL
ncbi:MAG: methyltransferase domain-containing protein [Deltaproteobacteria bacterium]|nr:methyltransferase domain-containing protein [Deltaproteobacteria bacterium]